MKKIDFVIILMFIVFVSLVNSTLFADEPVENAEKKQWQLHLELGPAFAGSNDIQVPNKTGRLFSTTDDDFEMDTVFNFRISLHFNFLESHNVSVMFSPLRYDFTGKTTSAWGFNGETFPSNEDVIGTYQSDSLRFSYLYDLMNSDTMYFGLGLTFALHMGEIHMEIIDKSRSSTYTETCFLPAINFLFQWTFIEKFSVIAGGDLMVLPGGRLVEILVGVQWDFHENVGVKLGFRIFEGGQDTDEIYNMKFISYIVFGIIGRI